MSDVYKLQYNGMTLAYPGWNGYISFEDAPKFKTLTLYASEGGTVTASVLTGMPGDTAQITTAYDTYYRFSGYDTAGGGSLNGDVYTFGDTDADISAVYKVNYFTATGNFEKGSNVSANRNESKNIAAKYAVHTNHTGDIPTSWYSTSNRWNPNNVSGYSITLKPSITYMAKYDNNRNYHVVAGTCTSQTLIGNTVTAQATSNIDKAKGAFFTTGAKYNTTVTTDIQNVNYGISGKITCGNNTYYHVAYSASLTTGTWTATGIAP